MLLPNRMFDKFTQKVKEDSSKQFFNIQQVEITPESMHEKESKIGEKLIQTTKAEYLTTQLETADSNRKNDCITQFQVPISRESLEVFEKGSIEVRSAILVHSKVDNHTIMAKPEAYQVFAKIPLRIQHKHKQRKNYKARRFKFKAKWKTFLIDISNQFREAGELAGADIWASRMLFHMQRRLQREKKRRCSKSWMFGYKSWDNTLQFHFIYDGLTEKKKRTMVHSTERNNFRKQILNQGAEVWVQASTPRSLTIIQPELLEEITPHLEITKRNCDLDFEGSQTGFRIVVGIVQKVYFSVWHRWKRKAETWHDGFGFIMYLVSSQFSTRAQYIMQHKSAFKSQHGFSRGYIKRHC